MPSHSAPTRTAIGSALRVLHGVPGAGGADAHHGLLTTARGALAALLHHSDHAAAPPTPEPGAATRRLDRLRYDVHDGPLQDIHLLAQDIRRFRDQLRPIVSDHPDSERALGRLDDLEAQAVHIDSELRRLATSLGPAVPGGAFAEALQQVGAAFSARAGIVPAMSIDGDLESLTDSQQIALLSVVREALSNVRLHSEATHVTVAVCADEQTITASVIDDGAGFDPSADGARAKREGRLGLVGMRERLRMLGGETRVSSAPGGPTVVSVTLPRWPVRGGPR